MRFFNTAGPVNPALHYCLDPLRRLELDALLLLIEQQKYFILHAPRQTGKTSCLLALVEFLNGTGRYRCVYANWEIGQAAREDVAAAMPALLNELAERARLILDDPWPAGRWLTLLREVGPFGALNGLLTEWSLQDSRPLVVLLDEVDALVGDTLIAVLRQLRGGYDKRPRAFPQTVILCGVRDVRDYRIHSGSTKEIITGGSAFNIKAKSLRLGNFTAGDMRALYAEHTAATGQRFTKDALERAWALSRGQPWLVNALGYETCFELPGGRDRAQPITADLLDEAKEALILRRETHLDQLADKLREPRVRRVIEPLLSGDDLQGQASEEDIQYVLDLGLIDRIEGQLAIANATYREIIPRQLTYVQQLDLEAAQKTAWYLRPDDRLDEDKLLAGFQDFFREHSEHWLRRFDYQEAGPQLLLQAFLQRLVNGGGRVEREYGLGRGRTDLLVLWRHSGGVQKIVIELKILRKSLMRTLAEGLEQTWQYLDRVGEGSGHLVVFDRGDRSWDEKIYRREETYQGRRIVVWGC
ncbi:MAG: ATP-binding protein [Candidatus Contendobacter sp.]|nr:ATP-binding protein [Candidatus Contendobacter sp.]MDG4556931.1 ATP-binding protein [Candidatus Contendobacter sp.]